MPFADIKVLDLSTFWAGAYLTCYLGAFGADVVKVESIQRPDGHRYSGACLRGDDWYERGPMWQATNLNKRDITLDLTSDGPRLGPPAGREADVVVENFSPRVVEQFGLDYDSLVELNPDVIMVRMPGFGLQGPWRDYVGWALNFEQSRGCRLPPATPTARRATYRDLPIRSSGCTPGSPCLPRSSIGAAPVRASSSRSHRSRSGRACAEPVIEYSMNGVVRPREGNRRRSYAQGVYPTTADDAWVALSVRDEADWAHLVEAMGRPDLLDEGRSLNLAHDEFDTVVAHWTRDQTARDIVNVLNAQHVPAEQVLTAERMYDIPQLDARGYYQEVEHPITGPLSVPALPEHAVHQGC